MSFFVNSSKTLGPKDSLETETPEGLLTSQSVIPDENSGATPTLESKDNGEIQQSAAENIAESTKTIAPLPPSAEKSALETQPRLRGVEPKKRLPNSQHEEDLLEIPAFLRRQAN